MQEKEWRAWRDSRGLKPVELNSWNKVLEQTTKEQLDRREVDCNFVDIGYQPRSTIWTTKGISGVKSMVLAQIPKRLFPPDYTQSNNCTHA